MSTIGTLFTGGNLVGVGAKLAGFASLFGVENVPEIAAVARMNGFEETRTVDILECDPRDFPVPDLLHASPVCTRFSISNKNRGESALDIACAKKVSEFIRVMKPRYFTLENVVQYRDSISLRGIIETLDDCGYWHNSQNLSADDFGVPQSRRRLFLRAVRGGFVPDLPQPVKHIGWYAAVEDIIDTFEPSEFAPWQLARLPEEIKTFLMAGGGNTNFNEASPGHGARDITDAVHTVTTLEGGGTQPKAFIMRAAKYGPEERGVGYYFESEPAPTVLATQPQPRAFVVDGLNAGKWNGITTRYGEEWLFTVASSQKGAHRAWLEMGRVVKISPRGLARFQSIPNDYILPTNARLAAKIIGNSVPPLEYQRIAEQFA